MLWFNRAEREKIKELVEKLEPQIKAKEKDIWEELKVIICQEKEMKRPESTFVTAKIVSKDRKRFRDGEKKGEEWFKFALSNGKNVSLWEHKLDDPSKYKEYVNMLVTGVNYEFEAEKGRFGGLVIRDVRIKNESS